MHRSEVTVLSQGGHDSSHFLCSAEVINVKILCDDIDEVSVHVKMTHQIVSISHVSHCHAVETDISDLIKMSHDAAEVSFQKCSVLQLHLIKQITSRIFNHDHNTEEDDDVVVDDDKLQIDAVSIFENMIEKENSTVHSVFLHCRSSNEI